MKYTNKGIVSLALILAATLMLVGCGGGTTVGSGADAGSSTLPAPSGGQHYITVATAGTGGTYYPLGGAFAEIWNNEVQGTKLNTTVASTGGSVANINMLKNDEVDVIFVQNDVCYYAQEGVVLFEESFPELRSVAALFQEPIQLVASASSNIGSVEDLRGKSVSLGAIGSGVEASARQVLLAAGIDPEKDLDAKFLSINESATALKDRQIDAFITVVGVPGAAVTDLASTNDIKIVPIEGAVADTLFSTYSYYSPYVVAAGSYKGQEEDVTTVCVSSVLAVKADFDEDLLYEMLETMYANKERIQNAHAMGAYVLEETALVGLSIDLHPGAERFFRDIGLLP